MSYCRFQNTLLDLRECEEVLDEGLDPQDLSDDERRACKHLIELCGRVFNNYGEGGEHV